MAASDTPDVPPIPVPPIEPAPKAKAPAKPVTSQIGKPAAAKSEASQIGKPAAAKPAAEKSAASKPAAAKAAKPAVAAAAPPAAERPNPYAQAAPAPTPPAPQPYSNGPYVAPPSQVLSIVSMSLGIVGVLLSFCYGMGFLFSIGAVVTGHIAQKKEKHAKPFWLTGIITGYAGLGIAALWLIVLVVFLIWTGSLASGGYYGY